MESTKPERLSEVARRLIAQMETPEKIARLKSLREQLKIPAAVELSILEIPALEMYAAQIDECPRCDGRKTTPCRKVALADGRLVSEDCPLQKARAAQKHAAELMATAQIPRRFRNISAGKDFIVTKGNRAAVEIAVACIDENAGAYFYGAVGVGKTMLACVIANERARQGKSSLFVTLPDMLEELRDFDNPERRAAKLNLLYTTPCLIIDDLGAEKPTQWAAETLFRICNRRYNEELQTIVTSNFSLAKIAARLPEYSGDRITRRLRAICEEIYMER